MWWFVFGAIGAIVAVATSGDSSSSRSSDTESRERRAEQAREQARRRAEQEAKKRFLEWRERQVREFVRQECLEHDLLSGGLPDDDRELACCLKNSLSQKYRRRLPNRDVIDPLEQLRDLRRQVIMVGRRLKNR